MKHKSAVMGKTIAFSKWNKPFKPVGIPSGWVKPCEGLIEMIPINIFQHYVIDKNEFPHNKWFLLMSMLNKITTTFRSSEHLKS